MQIRILKFLFISPLGEETLFISSMQCIWNCQLDTHCLRQPMKRGCLRINRNKQIRYKTAASVLLRAWSQLFLKFSVNSAEDNKPQPCLSSWLNRQALQNTVCADILYVFHIFFNLGVHINLMSGAQTLQ